MRAFAPIAKAFAPITIATLLATVSTAPAQQSSGQPNPADQPFAAVFAIADSLAASAEQVTRHFLAAGQR